MTEVRTCDLAKRTKMAVLLSLDQRGAATAKYEF